MQDVALGTTYWRADAADENGSITQETLGNSRITKRYFDRSSGHLLSIKTCTSSNETEVQNLELAFDQAANLRSCKDSSVDVNANAGIREEYGYDALYRLTQMRQYKPASLGTGSPNWVHNYSYDGFGIAQSGVLTDYLPYQGGCRRTCLARGN